MEECQHTSHYHVDLDRTTNSHGVVPRLWHGIQHQGKCSPNFQAHNARSTKTFHITLMWQERLASLAFDSLHVSIEYRAGKKEKEKESLLMTITNLCHWGIANEGCFIVGKPHPSHSFIEPYLTVYEIDWVARKKLMTDQISLDEKSTFVRQRGWIFIPSYESICVVKFHFISSSAIKRALELMASILGSTFQNEEVGVRTPPPIGIISSASMFNEGLSLKISIQDLWVHGGGDFNHCEVFQALPEGNRSQVLGHHGSL